MTLYFIELKLKNKSYKSQVSTEGCTYVCDFRVTIKNKFSPDLDSYSPVQLTLFQPDGTTEIYPQELIEKLNEFGVGPMNPLVVNVEEFPIKTGKSSRKHRLYKGMSSEISCTKYFDALAAKIFLMYEFDIAGEIPFLEDVFAAKNGQQGKPTEPSQSKWWDYRVSDQGPVNATPLPSLLTDEEWNKLESLAINTRNRLYDGQLPMIGNRKSVVIIPHSTYTQEFVDDLKSIAVISGIVGTEEDLIVQDEDDLL